MQQKKEKSKLQLINVHFKLMEQQPGGAEDMGAAERTVSWLLCHKPSHILS